MLWRASMCRRLECAALSASRPAVAKCRDDGARLIAGVARVAERGALLAEPVE